MSPPPKWKQTRHVPGPPRPGPITKVRGPVLTLEEIKFQHTAALHRGSNTHTIAKGNMDGWSKGKSIGITEPDWKATRERQFPAAFLRKRHVELEVTLGWPTKAAVEGSLTLKPVLMSLDLSKEPFKAGTIVSTLATVTVPFTIKAGDAAPKVMIKLNEILPDTVGGYVLVLGWEARPQKDPSDFTFTKLKTEHQIYTIYGPPLLSAATLDSIKHDWGARHLDTHTGTKKRLDKLMGLFGKDMRHAATTEDDVKELIWRVHTGINDHYGPPYFDAIHDVHLTHNGDEARHFDDQKHRIVGTGNPLPVTDQWLMWLSTTPPNWNTGACITYVQLLKTAVAAVGIFVRLAWVIPRTLVLPDGTTIPYNEDDLVALDKEERRKYQTASLKTDKEKTVFATLMLMEPQRRWERFEACLYTPGGRFLPGGYTTAGVKKDAPSFRDDRGFASALDVLHWWCNTKRGAFRRFMCWVDLDNVDADGKPVSFWDRDGKFYPASQWENIVRNGKQVPPPPKPPRRSAP